ncbi:MAG: sugar transferase [Clostridia bacterium]|nr:sugar transferase [Clostridia bacterium]
MYKRSAQGWFKHLDFILWDVLILQVAFILGYMIRHGWGLWPYLRPEYNSLAIILVVVDILVAVIFNTMHNVMKRGKLKELTESIKHVALVLLIMSLYLFSTQAGDAFSRITLYLTSGLHLVLGYLIRLAWKPIIRKINKGKNKSTMILVAEENSVARILKHADELDGFEYSGLVLSDRNAKGETVEGIRVVADIEDAADYICREWVDEVFVYPEHLSDLKTASYENIENFIDDTFGTQEPGKYIRPTDQSGVGRLIEQCREMAIPVHIRLPISSAGGKSFVEKVGGYNVLTMTANYAGPVQLVLKRILDILGGLVGSLLALILLAVIGPKIKKESPGPILFKQVRIGKNGKRFNCYKIRSMYLDAEERKKELMAQNRVSDGMMFKLDFDPRIIGNRIVDGKQVTGIGEKIRSSSLDEFPQFFNVLKGDMSLVGTRPPTEDEWEKYKYHHRARLSTKPGLTGMWQVNGRSEITDFEEVVKLDTEYINNWSIGLDIRILLKTVKAVLKHEGAM